MCAWQNFYMSKIKDGFQVEVFVGVVSIKVHAQLANLLIFEVASNFPIEIFLTNLVTTAQRQIWGAREARGL